MMEQDETTGPINLGNPAEFTIAQLAELTLELTGSSSSFECKPLPQDDPTRRKPDISLARRTLDGWEPTVQLREGLLKTIAYFDELLAST